MEMINLCNYCPGQILLVYSSLCLAYQFVFLFPADSIYLKVQCTLVDGEAETRVGAARRGER